ncbi:MAG: ABC transporter substrate-binding protein [Clostridia bacterium]|nr:ABC transporter substrate-binding protein [Clostridia bacterium]
MKKILAFVLALCMMLSLSAVSMAEPVARVAGMKGPTAMGMVKMMKDDAGETYDFNVIVAIDEINTKLVKGELDIAAVPANVASVLYNKTQGKLQVLAINTLGVLYIVENGESIQSVEDLRGKTIYSAGKGATPEYALNYVLSSNGIDPEKDVTIEFKSEQAECLSALLANEGSVAMMPQPFVTTAQTKAEGIRVALDMTEEWAKLQEGAENPSAMLTGVVVARKEFVEKNPEVVNAFLDSCKASVDFTNDNVDEAAAIIASYDIIPEGVAKKAVPHCSIVCIEGAEMQTKLSGYLNVLFEQNPSAVGGAVPADDFYYQR